VLAVKLFFVHDRDPRESHPYVKYCLTAAAFGF
jgi:hypothetical protein